jgi:hypothetical protein
VPCSSRVEIRPPSVSSASARASAGGELLRAVGGEPVGEAVEGGADELLRGLLEQLWMAPGLGGEDAQELRLAVEFGEGVAGGHRELRSKVADVIEDVADVAQGVEALEVAFDAGGEQLVLAGEVVVDAAGAGTEARCCLDLDDRRRLEPVLAEQAHRLVKDPIAGCQVCHVRP